MTNQKQNTAAQLIRYGGGESIEGAPTRSDIISKCDNGLTAILQRNLSDKQPMHFMPNDVGDATEYINGISTYILRIYGTLINGQKARVDIMGIKPFFDIVVPGGEQLAIFKSNLVKIISKTLKGTSKFGIKIVDAFPIRGYHTKKKLYIRVITWNQYDRLNALKAAREANLETASDDLNCKYYYRKIAREKRLPLSSWATLYDYIYDKNIFRVSVDNYKPIDENEYTNPLIEPALFRDKTLVLTWDIETYSSRGTGGLPVAKNAEDQVFMICMTVHWKDDSNPLAQICLVDVETKPDPGWITVICGNQTNLLKAFTLYWKYLTPDIQIGFNDSQYDWPFVIEKAKNLGILEWMFNHMSPEPLGIEKITKWQYQYNAIKVNDENFHSRHLKIPGCVAIDVRPCFKKLYSKAEKSSLAFYLEKCELDNKVELPNHRMNKYYERALKETNNTTAEQMREVAGYCIVDALSCQRLMIKHNVIDEYREKVSISFLSLFDAHYFADGMKVKNLLASRTWELGFLNTMIPQKQTESGKYPGAYVFPPEKGLENKRPVTGFDYASLYPSLIMTYNLSPDKIILSREHAISVARSGKKLHMIEFEFNGRDIIAWSVKHENQSEMEGLYVIVLKELLIKRNEMKKRLAPLSEKKENMELILSNVEGERTIPETIEYILKNAEKKNRDKLTKKLHPFINKNNHEFMVEYNSICFDHACLNAKQTALKVYMNTFYGEAGNNESPFFSLQLAGGVTSAGQRNIKLVADFVKNKEFKIKYGDTDSLYLVCPEEYFQECDTAYDNGNGISKEKYWNEMVKISMRVMGELRDKVNKFLKKDNGSTYLKMAYEEVLFPVVFTGKKKYYGIQHIKEPNFDPDPDKLFIRGVDIVKRGQSKLFRKIGKEIMRESMEIDNNRTLYQIVEEVLKNTVKNSSQIDINECIRTYAWKPDKDNKSVKRFISRIKSNHAREVEESKQFIKKGLAPVPYLYNTPEPGERFECVVVEREDRYDEYGKKISWKVGGHMEYPDVVKKLNKKIDINYYLKSVVGLCARFINSDKCFEPPTDDESLINITAPDKLWTKKDELEQKSAERWIKGYIKDLRDGPKKEEIIISHLWGEAVAYAEKLHLSISNIGKKKETGYYTLNNDYLNVLDKIADSTRLKLSDLLSKLSKLNEEYRNGLHKLITQAQKCKPDITILEEYIFLYNLEPECETLIEFRNTWYKVIGIKFAHEQALSIMHNSKKDDSSEEVKLRYGVLSDIDEIVDLYY